MNAQTPLSQEDKNFAASKRLARFIFGSDYLRVLTDDEIWNMLSDREKAAIQELVSQIPPGTNR